MSRKEDIRLDKDVADQVIRLASHWFHQSPQLSLKDRLDWLRWLQYMYGNYFSREHIALMNIGRATSGVENKDDPELIARTIALLKTYIDQKKEEILTPHLQAVENHVHGLKESRGDIDEKISDFENAYRERLESLTGRIELKVPTNVNLLFIDHLLRWAALWGLMNISIAGIWILNFTLIPVIILLAGWLRAKRVKKFNSILLENYGGKEKFRLVPRRSAYQWTLIVIQLILSLAISFMMLERWGDPDGLILVLFAFLLVMYYAINLQFFTESKLQETDLATQIEAHREIGPSLDADQNDEELVKLGNQLDSIKGKLEAYVLESALFGALAFSGFLQIMAENLIGFDDLELFSRHVFELISGLVFLQGSEIASALQNLSDKTSLFALVSVETLVCSIFFLMVIASRLQFSDVADRVSYSLGIVKAFNLKEEAHLHSHSEKSGIEGRLNYLNNKIYRELGNARSLLSHMHPVAEFMRYFRNAGIVTFFIVLVSSGLFISPMLSWAFAVMGLVTWGYFNRQILSARISQLLFAMRTAFVRYGLWFFLIPVAIIYTGYFLRTRLYWENTDIFINAGFFTLGACFFVWTFFVPHYDALFEKHLASRISSSTWWMGLRFFWGLTLLMVFTGFGWQMTETGVGSGVTVMGVLLFSLIFLLMSHRLAVKKWVGAITGLGVFALIWGISLKLLHLPAAAEITITGLSLIGGIICYMNFFYIRSRWTALIRTLGPVVYLVAAVFKFIHLPGANILLMAGHFSMALTLLSFFLWPVRERYFHKLLLVNAGIICMLSFSLLIGENFTPKLAYSHYTSEDTTVERLSQLRTISRNIRNNSNQTNRAALQKLNDELSWYLHKTEGRNVTDLGYTIMMDCYVIASNVFREDEKDPRFWEIAGLLHYANEINERADFRTWTGVQSFKLRGKEYRFIPLLEPAMWLRLGETEKARRSLGRFEELIDPGNESIMGEISSMRTHLR